MKCNEGCKLSSSSLLHAAAAAAASAVNATGKIIDWHFF
jgi:hypothetical protein